MKIRVGQVWKDKKTGNKMRVISRIGDRWNCVLLDSETNHKMTSWSINKYWDLVVED